jgi:hypothetical protein
VEGNGRISESQLQQEKGRIIGKGGFQVRFQECGFFRVRPGSHIFPLQSEDASGLQGGCESEVGGHQGEN